MAARSKWYYPRPMSSQALMEYYSSRELPLTAPQLQSVVEDYGLPRAINDALSGIKSSVGSCCFVGLSIVKRSCAHHPLTRFWCLLSRCHSNLRGSDRAVRAGVGRH